MRRGLGFAVVCLVMGGCSGGATSPGSPTPTPPETAAAATTTGVAPAPALPIVGAPDPVFTLTGPTAGCSSLTEATKWTLDVASAGPGFHLALAIFRDGHAGCEDTLDHPAPNIVIDGLLDYSADSKGRTILTYPAEACGRVQVDLGMTTADGKHRIIIGQVLNSGKDCDPPPPPPTCATDPKLCPPPPTCATDPKLCPPPPPPPTCATDPKLCPPPPPPPSCSQVNPARYDDPTLALSHASIVVPAKVYNAGTWKLVMYAASASSEYPNSPDYTKDTDEKVLTCGTNATLSVSYSWAGHPSRYWWVKLFKDGSLVYTSPRIDKNNY